MPVYLHIPVDEANEEAMRQYIATLNDDEDRNALNEARIALANQYFFSGKLDLCEAQLDMILASTDKIHERMKDSPFLMPRFLALTLTANLALKRGDLDSAESRCNQCLQEAPEPFVQPRGQALWVLAEVLMGKGKGKFDEAKETVQRSLAMGEKFLPVQVFCKASLGLIAAYQGYEDPKQYYHEAVNIAEKLDRPFARGHAYFYAGKTAQMLSSLREARGYLEKAYQVYHEYKFKFHETWCRFELLHTQFLSEQYLPDEVLTQFVEEVRRQGYEESLSYWLKTCSNDHGESCMRSAIRADVVHA